MRLDELAAAADGPAHRRRARRSRSRPRLRQPPGRARDALLLRAGREGRRARFAAGGGRARRRGPGRRARAPGLEVPQVVVADARAAMAPVAARFWGDPTAELRVAGITGTNGKTTTAFLLREMLEAAAIQSGLLGTVKQVVGAVEEEVERTTPEAIDLQETFRRMLAGRRPGLRDGGLLARARPAPGRRGPLRARPVHQPDPGPPRLPRRHGGLLPLASAGCSPSWARKRRSSTSTTPTGAAWPRNSSA